MGDITTQTPSLGRTYALSGDTAKSRTAYKDVVALWKDADPDIPILIAGRLSDPMSTVGCPARRHRPPTMRASVCTNSAHSRTACDEHLASDQSYVRSSEIRFGGFIGGCRARGFDYTRDR
jgi:hypothetical protein